MRRLSLVVGLFVLFLTINLNACLASVSGDEPTADAKEQIIKDLNDNNFNEALKVFKEHEKNYKYLTKNFIPSLYSGLKAGLKNKNKKQVIKYLELSIAAEVQRKINEGLQNIKDYNVAKVIVLNAKKFYNLLSFSLDKQTNKKLKSAVQKCIEAIGNPGLFGVGKKPANIDKYKKNQKIIIDIIQSL